MARRSTSLSGKSSRDKDLGEIRELLKSPGIQLMKPGFYERPTLEVARDLLGKILLIRPDAAKAFGGAGSGVTAARIVETEGYHGDDPASHSFRGKTPRNEPMFGEPGHAYVYFIYGMYEMLNFVTESEGTPGAVLIRAAEPVFGKPVMRSRRPNAKNFTDGPGKLTRAMGVGMRHNRVPLWGPEIYVLDDGWKPAGIHCSPRVGIKDAADLEWRYFLSENEHVSKAPQNREARPHK